MIFGTVDIRNSEGCYLAHSLQTAEGRISKGTFLTPDIVEQLAASGLTSVLVARLGPDDVHEDTAAQTLAQGLAGKGVKLSRARTGRVNLHAQTEGLCLFDVQTIQNANAIDEGITIATIAPNQWVPQGRMVATIKIIPYAVDDASLQKVITIVAGSSLSVCSAITHRAALIQTRLNSTREQVLDKTRRITEDRLTPRAAELISEQRCQHTVDSLTPIIKSALQLDVNWLLIVGASAISDRRDVIPEAIIAAGGQIDRYGIPVDPGNLLLLGRIDDVTIIGLPGCSRSAKYNGLDLVMDRLACEVPITNNWLSSLSVGGLLAEIADRPTPRIVAKQTQQVGVIILAAGSSRRAGNTNKLLFDLGEHAMVTKVARVACASQADRVIAVTGFEHSRVEQALATTSVECHYNKAHASGMASSVIAGVSRLTDCDAVLVCLGDMPHVSVVVINQLIDAFKANPDKSIVIPVSDGRRGNPVLFGKVFFDTLLTLEGDTGAKYLLKQYPDEIFEVAVEGDGILLDYDTQKELDTLL